MFCLKEKNAKKLNSHRWALEAFAPQLQPNIMCVMRPLLDSTAYSSDQHPHRRRNEAGREIALLSLEDV